MTVFRSRDGKWTVEEVILDEVRLLRVSCTDLRLVLPWLTGSLIRTRNGFLAGHVASASGVAAYVSLEELQEEEGNLHDIRDSTA